MLEMSDEGMATQRVPGKCFQKASLPYHDENIHWWCQEQPSWSIRHLVAFWILIHCLQKFHKCVLWPFDVFYHWFFGVVSTCIQDQDCVSTGTALQIGGAAFWKAQEVSKTCLGKAANCLEAIVLRL